MSSTSINKIHKNLQAIHLITPQEKRIYQRPYLSIDRCSLARSQRPTGQLSAKPNFETPPPKTEFRSNPQVHQLTADRLPHPKTTPTQLKGVQIQGQLRMGNKIFTAGGS